MQYSGEYTYLILIHSLNKAHLAFIRWVWHQRSRDKTGAANCLYEMLLKDVCVLRLRPAKLGGRLSNLPVF